MRITELSVKRPVATTVIYIFLLITSIIALFKLPIDLFPQLELPVLTVITFYPKATALDVEEKVTKVIENAVASVPGVDTIESRSEENVSIVMAKFKWGTNIDEKAADVRDLLELSKMALPEDVEKPRVIKFDPSLMPIMFISVAADKAIKDLRYIVDKEVADEIRKVEGVAGVVVRGGDEREVSVVLDPQKLAFYRLTVQQVISAIQQENVEVPIGDVYEGFRKYTVRLSMKFGTPEEIGNLVVGNFLGKPVYLYQVGEVKDSYIEKVGETTVNGRDALLIMVRKKAQANTVSVCSAVNKKLSELRKILPQLKINVVMDSSEYILKVVKNLEGTIFIGGILVILTVVFFLGDVIPAFIIVLQIPITLILAFLFLYLFGYTINLVSLMSLSLAIGMVVDNSIVVVDHILRHIGWGKKSLNAAVDAPSEVAGAIIASTLTTIVVFIPLLYVSGLIPLLFKQLAIVMAVTLVCSLTISLTLSPMLTSRLCSEKEYQKKAVMFVSRIVEKIELLYEDVINWSLGHKKLTLLGFLGMFFVSLYIFLFFTGKEFLPKSDENIININFEAPKGMRVEETFKIAKQIEQKIMSLLPGKYYKTILVRCGESSGRAGGGVLGRMLGQQESSNSGSIMISLVDKEFRDKSSIEITEVLRNNLRKIAGIIKLESAAQSSVSTTLLGGAGKAVSIELRGNNLDESLRLAEEIKNKLQSIAGVRNTTVSLEKGSYQIIVKLDREKVKMLGISSGYIADILRKTFYGYTASQYTPKAGSIVETSYDIFVKVDKDYRNDVKNLADLPIILPTGKVIPLRNIADFEISIEPIEIQRKDGARVVKIECDVFGRALSKVREDVEKMLKTIPLPYGYSIKFGGEVEQQTSTFRDLTLMLFLGILLVYLIMTAQFEDILDPFIVMFSVPFAVVGVLIGIFLWGQNFNIMSFVGLLLLVGIVVNNAIVLVDYIKLLRSRGMALIDAVKESCKTRLKPILMTAITTILGSLPLAVSRGSGAEYFSSMGVAIVSGLTFSTLITLIFVPTLYTVVHSRIRKQQTK
jgi:HAE1 family hydrophobic/amphiphilic exporter-1